MRVVVAGGSGFLGRALVGALRTAGHDVQVLTRGPTGGRNDIVWAPNGESGPWAAHLVGVDAIVNLAGAGLADRRWTATRKTGAGAEPGAGHLVARGRGARAAAAAASVRERLRRGDLRSRTATNRSTRPPPPVLTSSPRWPGAWEQSAAPVASACRLVLLRTAMVLGPGGGALGRMLLPFKLGVGGRLGSGRQWMPWIHIDDWVGARPAPGRGRDDGRTVQPDLTRAGPQCGVHQGAGPSAGTAHGDARCPRSPSRWRWVNCRTCCSPASGRCRPTRMRSASASAIRASTTRLRRVGVAAGRGVSSVGIGAPCHPAPSDHSTSPSWSQIFALGLIVDYFRSRDSFFD